MAWRKPKTSEDEDAARLFEANTRARERAQRWGWGMDTIARFAVREAVVRAAGGQCHRPRCSRSESPWCRLIAAPADLSLSEQEAARLPSDALVAWCPKCYDAALAVARRAARKRRAARQEQEAARLFEIES